MPAADPATLVAEALPHSVDAERAVLAAMMLRARAIDTARQTLKASDFYVYGHSLVFDALCTLADAGRVVDTLVLTEFLRAAGTLEQAGGMLWLAGLASEVASDHHIEAHAELVVEFSRLRALTMMAARAHARTRTGGGGQTSRQVAEALVGELSDLLLGASQGGLVPAGEAVSDALQRIQLAAQRHGGVTGIPTGLPLLTRATGGWQPGSLSLLGARPSLGKTALALAFALEAARDGRRTAVFSLEMTACDLAQRLLAMDGRLDLRQVRAGELSDAQWATVVDSSSHISALPLHIDHRSSASVAQIRTQCRRMRATGGLDMVIVDYLQLVSPEGKHGNREQEVASMSRAFKQLAGEMEVPVLLLSQLNRGPAASTDGRPHLYSLRESGSLEQDADAVMLLYRPSDHGLTNIQTGPTANDTEPAAGLVELILAKNRNGPTLSMWLDWHAPTTCFREHVRSTYAPGGGEAREEEFGL